MINIKIRSIIVDIKGETITINFDILPLKNNKAILGIP